MIMFSAPGRRGAVVMVLVAGSLAACGGERPRGAQGGVATITRAVVTDSALPNSFTITPSPFDENTAKVAPPSVNFPNGLIAIQTGQNGPVSLLTRDLYDANGMINTSGSTTTSPYPSLNMASPATDNQMVRLSDGSFLAMKNTTFWPNPPMLPYSDLTNISGLSVPGARGGHSFVGLSSTGQSSWNVVGLIDFGTFAGGKWGYPQQGLDMNGNTTWQGGGSDRQEVYACPFTHNIYLTGHLISGPYNRGGVVKAALDTIALFMSQDAGATWTVVQEGLPLYVPVVMTSTPNGRLFLLGIVNGAPRVQFSQPMGVGGMPVLTPMQAPSFDVSYVENGQRVPPGTSADTGTPGFTILSDQDPSKGLNAFNGASEGGTLKFNNQCTSSNPDCAWSYRSGMIISGRRNPAGAPFALNAFGGAREGGPLQLTAACTTGNADCTWRYKQGMILSERDRSLAIKVQTDGTLTLTRSCAATNPACTFTLSRVLLSSGRDFALGVNAFGGAADGVTLKLTRLCGPTNKDCTWTFQRGMILSDKNPSLAVNAFGGAAQGTVIKLSSICTQSNPDCTWTWTAGELISDRSASPVLPINAFLGAVEGATLQLNNECTAANPDCVFNGFSPSIEARTLLPSPHISRISTDSTTSKVRIVYPSVNAKAMQEARIVNFDASDPTHPTSVTTIRASEPDTHSVMFTTFIDPDYLDMPSFIKSNKTVLYWEDVPERTAADYTFSARYAMITGDADVGPVRPLSVTNGALVPWTSRQDWGDYVTGGFFWAGKTLNYLAQWSEPSGIRANIVTANAAPGFLITSDVNASLAINAAGGAAEGTVLKLFSSCPTSNPDCTWSYQRGMIVSDSDPTLALTSGTSPVNGTQVKLTRSCSRDNPSCTWTYKQGRFISDRNSAFSIRAVAAQAGTTLTLSNLCGTSAECKWSLPHALIMIDRNSKLALNAFNGAVDGGRVSLHDGCALNNPDCTWTLSGGRIASDTNSALRVRATGGAANGSLIKLSSTCGTSLDCRWTWSKGELISDNSTTVRAINAFGGATFGATLQLNSECTASNPDCLFSGLFGP